LDLNTTNDVIIFTSLQYFYGKLSKFIKCIIKSKNLRLKLLLKSYKAKRDTDNFKLQFFHNLQRMKFRNKTGLEGGNCVYKCKMKFMEHFDDLG